MENLIFIPTHQQPTKLHFVDNALFISPKYQLSKSINSSVEGRDIYIISNDIPKLDEFGINTRNNIIFKSNGFTPDEYDKKYCRKIILTTDLELIKNGVQAISNDFLDWFIINSSCRSVVVDDKYKDDFNEKYSIIIPETKLVNECNMGFLKESTFSIFRFGDNCLTVKETIEVKDLNYWKRNAEEDYSKTPISVLRYISELEKTEKYNDEDLLKAFNDGQENMDFSEMYGWSSILTEENWLNKFKTSKNK